MGRGDNKGFTLLEVMTAITVLAFILGIVYTTFATVSESDRRGAAAMESNIKVRNLAEQMTGDLSSLFIDFDQPPENYGPPGLKYGMISGDPAQGGASLDFTAIMADSGDFNDAVIAEIGYTLLPSEGGGFRLMKRIDDTPDDNLREGGHSFELMEGISSLVFEFLDNKGEWQKEWDSLSENSLPRSIKIVIAFDEENGERKSSSMQVPVYLGVEL